MISHMIVTIYVTYVSHNVPSFFIPHDQLPVNFNRPEVDVFDFLNIQSICIIDIIRVTAVDDQY